MGRCGRVALLVAGCLYTIPCRGETLNVGTGQEFSDLESAYTQAGIGDMILLHPGVHETAPLIIDKPITLASCFYTTADPACISDTVLEVTAFDPVLEEPALLLRTSDVRIIGLSIEGVSGQSAMPKGIVVEASTLAEISYNRLAGFSSDALSYEDSSGGVCAHNLLEGNGDDGIDLDNTGAVLIEHNSIRHNGNDGIEQRLYQAPATSEIVIRYNEIHRNAADGIQFIQEADAPRRIIHVHHNLIYDNAQAGIGNMADSISDEDYEGSSQSAPLFLFNNTITGNDHGVTGGKNMLVFNNVIAHNTSVGVKRIDGDSVVAHGILFGNGTQDDLESVLGPGIQRRDPGLDRSLTPAVDSPCIDAGAVEFSWGALAETVAAASYAGAAPDLGAIERELGTELRPGTGLVQSNQPPVVFAGHDQVARHPQNTVDLAAEISDDGPVAALDLEWSQESGPTAARFTSTTRPDVSVTFPAQGHYRLRLEVSDGEHLISDSLMVSYVKDSRDSSVVVSPGEPTLVEAEDYRYLFGPAEVLADEQASAGRTLTMPAGADGAGYSEYRLIFAEARQYTVWLRLRAASAGSLGASLNQRAEVELDVSPSECFVWYELNEPLNPPPGSYPFGFRGEPGLAWDAFTLTADPDFAPSPSSDEACDVGGGGAAGQAGDFGRAGAAGQLGEAGQQEQESSTPPSSARSGSAACHVGRDRPHSEWAWLCWISGAGCLVLSRRPILRRNSTTGQARRSSFTLG